MTAGPSAARRLGPWFPLALVAVLGLTSCGAAAGDVDGGAVVVTVTSTAAGSPSSAQVAPIHTAASTPPTGSAPGPASASSPATTASPTTTSPAKPAPSDRPAATTSSGPSTSATSSRPPSSPSTGDLFKDAITLAAAAGVEPADPDTPGPESGPPCPADHAYVNEAPTGLRSDVITAWKAVVRAGKTKGITVCLNDGKRSRAQQLAQYQDYVEQYGKAVADQLVLQPNKSAHVIGIAVDAQPADAYQWLQSTKGSLGFCRIYDNEAWHFEYNPAYRTDGCPARLPKPAR